MGATILSCVNLRNHDNLVRRKSLIHKYILIYANE